ncbi:MAG: hypothetical protein ABSF64_29810 [Bryobacteraceae bacterium]|jgi:hypothetical protein
MTHAFEPREDPNIDSVWRWFEFQAGVLREERERILRIDTLGSGIDAVSLRSYELPLTGLTRGEVEKFFNEQAGQLELLVMFELLSTAEAILRNEFKTRVQARKKMISQGGSGKFTRSTGRRFV